MRTLSSVTVLSLIATIICSLFYCFTENDFLAGLMLVFALSFIVFTTKLTGKNKAA